MDTSEEGLILLKRIVAVASSVLMAAGTTPLAYTGTATTTPVMMPRTPHTVRKAKERQNVGTRDYGLSWLAPVPSTVQPLTPDGMLVINNLHNYHYAVRGNKVVPILQDRVVQDAVVRDTGLQDPVVRETGLQDPVVRGTGLQDATRRSYLFNEEAGLSNTRQPVDTDSSVKPIPKPRLTLLTTNGKVNRLTRVSSTVKKSDSNSAGTLESKSSTQTGHVSKVTQGALSSRSGGPLAMTNLTNIGTQVASISLSLVGSAYRYGGDTAGGFDCSGLVQYVYQKAGVVLPRTSYEQYLVGSAVALTNIRPGDLLFFSTYGGGPSHVAIYVGNGLMVQALNSGSGVVVSKLSDAYYQNRFVGAKRP